MKARNWLLLALILAIVISVWGRIDLARRLRNFHETTARVTEANRALLIQTDSLLARDRRRQTQLTAGDAERQRWQGEAERRGAVIAALREHLPPAPSVTPDTCLPWATRAAALAVLNTALEEQGVLQSRRLTSTAAALELARSGWDSTRAALLLSSGQLRTTDSLLRRVPRMAGATLSLKLDLRTDFGDIETLAGVQYRHWYVQTGYGLSGKKLVVGWTRSVRVF